MLLNVRLNSNIIVSGKKNYCKSPTAVSPSCHSNLNCKLQTRPEDYLTFSYLRPFCSVPWMKNLMLKVFIDIYSWSVIVHVDLQNDLRACATDKSTVEFYDDDTDLSK